MSLWSWIVTVGFVGRGLCMMVVIASCYFFKEERETKRKREKGMKIKERIKINKEYLNEVLKKIEPLMLGVL